MSVYKDIGELRFWVQKVLPLVYDDSLSYYELISKVIATINDLIANNALIPDLIEEEVKELLDTDEFKSILEDYLSENENIALRTDLTSNDIDIEELYTYHFDDGRYTGSSTECCVFQSIVVMNDGNIVTIANDETDTTDVGKVRVYGSDGVLIRERSVSVGHAQDATTNGTDKIYVCHSVDTSGTRSNKISVINYSDLSLEETIVLPKVANVISYNYDKEQFITKVDNVITIWANDLQTEISTLTLPWEFASVYGGSNKFDSVSRQGSLYYKNMLMCIYSYPNAFVWYDLDDGSVVKIYNPPYRIGLGSPFDEIECGYMLPSGDGTIYLTSFHRLTDGKVGSNVIGTWNPWKNGQTNYRKYARYIVPINIYVDGDTNEPTQYGTLVHPYKYLTQAITAIKSINGANTPINIYCKENTNVGALRATQVGNININTYSSDGGAGSGDKFTIDGIRIVECAQVYIRNANIVYNNMLGNDYDCAVYIDRIPLIEIRESNVSNGDYGIGVVNDSRVTLRSVAISGFSDGGIYCATGSTTLYDSNTTFSSTPYFNQYFGKVISAGEKYHNSNGLYNDAFPDIETYVISNDTISEAGTYDMFEHTNLNATVRGKLNYIVFDIGRSPYHQSYFVRVPDSISTTMNFNFIVPLASGTGNIIGTFNVETGNLVVSSITSPIRIWMIQAF